MSRLPNAPTASAITFNASANISIPALLFNPILLKSVTFRNKANSAIATPHPINPFVNSAGFSLPSFSTASPITRRAAANTTIPAAVLVIPFEDVSIKWVDATNMAISPATEVNPFAISFQFNSDRLFMESDNIPTAVANSVKETPI